MEFKARLSFNGIDIASDRRGDVFRFADKAVLSLERTGDCVHARLDAMESGEYIVSVEIAGLGRCERVFIPSIWYRGNEEGEGMFPSIAEAEYWSFLEHRMPLPGVIVYIREDGSVIGEIEPAENADEYSAVSWGPDYIAYEIPGKERPWSYRGKKSLVDTSGEVSPTLHLEAGDVYTRDIYIYETEETDELKAYESHLRNHCCLDSTRPSISWNSYRISKLARLLNLTQKDDCGNAYLKMGEGNGAEQDVYEFTSASFLVKSLEAAVAFASIEIEESDMIPELQKAMDRIHSLFGDTVGLKELASLIGNHFLSSETSAGIFHDCENLKTGEKGGYLGIGEHPEFAYLVNARTNGEAMSSYVALYEILGRREYLDVARRVAFFYVDNQLESGSYGRWFSPDGEAVNSSGTNGAYVGVFLLRLLPHLEGTERAIVSASVEKAIRYYSRLAVSGDFLGDTLDADSADKEAGISLMSLMLEAMERSGVDDELLEAAGYSASFILSWVWHYDVVFPHSSPLAEEDFHTKGMSAVSIAHHHLDFYGMLIARDFMRLWRITGDDFYRKEAVLMADACRALIAFNPGELGRDIYGYQPEQVNHTTWDYFSRADRMNGTYDIDIAWNNVLGLSSYLYIEKEFKGIS